MYRVTVKYLSSQGGLHWEPVDAKGFEFGDWKEIGFWLDDCGYNRKGYQATIVFDNE